MKPEPARPITLRLVLRLLDAGDRSIRHRVVGRGTHNLPGYAEGMHSRMWDRQDAPTASGSSDAE
jgi:hypothetical protein